VHYQIFYITLHTITNRARTPAVAEKADHTAVSAIAMQHALAMAIPDAEISAVCLFTICF